jgi:hypothetical protein
LSDIELAIDASMPILRKIVMGPPHTYVVQAESTQAMPLFDPVEATHFLHLVDLVSRAFDARLFGYRIIPTGFHLIFRHMAVLNDADEHVRKRWQSIGGSPLTTLPRIKNRFTSLGGFMQTLLQRFSRDWNRRHARRGHLWASRYRACLLADDLALLASVAWLEKQSSSPATVIATSANLNAVGEASLRLTPLPLRLGPDGSWYTADESPPGLAPLREAQVNALFNTFVQGIPPDDLARYGTAIARSLAFGRPDSLSQTIARLSRDSGRGRSRQIHDLDDQLGLCGVWG